MNDDIPAWARDPYTRRQQPLRLTEHDFTKDGNGYDRGPGFDNPISNMFWMWAALMWLRRPL